MSELINLSDIVMTAGTQMRAWMDARAISEYAALMKEGVQFDPVELMRVEDGRLLLIDGFHRLSAAREANIAMIRATITDGTLNDAIWLAIAANRKQGVRRSSNDIRKAVEAALLHPQGALLSDRAIAEHVGCSHPVVGSVRAELVATGKITSEKMRKGKDGRTIDTDAIAANHQIAKWSKLIYAPWIDTHKKADLVLIKDGDWYLHVWLNYGGRGSLLHEQYRLRYGSWQVRGEDPGQPSSAGAMIDDGYVALLEADGLRVVVELRKDLPTLMQRVVKGAFDRKGHNPVPQHKFIRIPDDLVPGELVASRQVGSNVISTVVSRWESCVQVGTKTDSDYWTGQELIPLELARAANPGLNIISGQMLTAGGTWQEQYSSYKRFYSPSTPLVIAAGYDKQALAFGDDAAWLLGVDETAIPLTIEGTPAALRFGGYRIKTEDTYWVFEVHRDENLARAWGSALRAVQSNVVSGDQPKIDDAPRPAAQTVKAGSAGDHEPFAMGDRVVRGVRVGTVITDSPRGAATVIVSWDDSDTLADCDPRSLGRLHERQSTIYDAMPDDVAALTNALQAVEQHMRAVAATHLAETMVESWETWWDFRDALHAATGVSSEPFGGDRIGA